MMSKSVRAILIAAAVVVVTGAYSGQAASADGRQLDGTFCSHAVPGSPYPAGLCIQLAFGGQTVQGYYGSTGHMDLRPGDYWLTVTDTSNAHNFTLTGQGGLDMDITPVANGSTPSITETVKLHLEHGSYTLLCDNDGHSSAGMQITIDVGGVGQVS